MRDRPITKRTQGTRNVILAFVCAINEHNLERLGELMTEDHAFVDAHGKKLQGKSAMAAGWQQYLGWFPDYRIDLEDIVVRGKDAFLVGRASGSRGSGKAEEVGWSTPAAWRAEVRDGRVSHWQVYADTLIPLRCLDLVQIG